MSSTPNIGEIGKSQNPTCIRISNVPSGQPIAVRCVVKPGLVELHLGGRRYSSWTGDPAELSLSPNWKTDRPIVFVGMGKNASCRITR